MNFGDLLHTMGAVLSVFILFFVGFGIRKLRLLRTEDASILNTLVLYVMLPVFIFNAIYSYRQPIPLSIAKVPIIGFAVMLVVMGLAYVVGKSLKLGRGIIAGLILASAFGNTAFIGYPVIQAALHDKSAMVTTVLYDELAMATPLYTIGLLILAGFAGEKLNRRHFSKAPMLPQLWAIPIGLALRPVTLPEPLLEALQYLSNGTIALVMISLGLMISSRSIKGFAIPVAIACILKLAVLPALTYLAVRHAGFTDIMVKATVIEAGMPTAMMAGVLASTFGENGEFVAGAIFFTTLISLISIPLMLFLLGV